MNWLILAISCNWGANNPPRFQEFNGIPVRYIFGIGFLPPTNSLSAQQGEDVAFEVNVTDIDGDDIELLFPMAQKGLNFNSSETSGTWTVPTEPISNYAQFQILAVDEHGATDVLFVEYIIEDFSYDTGDWLSFIDNSISGNINIEQGWSGEMTFSSTALNCQWTWPQSIGTAIEDCPICNKAWAISLGRGSTSYGDCSMLEADLQEIASLRLGYANQVTIDGVFYQNPVFLYVDGEWMPNGTGHVQDQRFDFEVEVF